MNRDIYKGELTAIRLRHDLSLITTQAVDLEQLANNLSIRVVYEDLGNGIEGACKSRGNKRLIVLSPFLKGRRRRFTFAHEVGHLLIHHGSYLCKTQDFFWTSTQSAKEREANAFAAELLLPKVEVVRSFENNDLSIENAKSIADHYGVSLLATLIKLLPLFEEKAIFLVHDGERVLRKVYSNNCYLKTVDLISPSLSMLEASNSPGCEIVRNVDPSDWAPEASDNLICDEHMEYFPKLKQYYTILKFYEEY